MSLPDLFKCHDIYGAAEKYENSPNEIRPYLHNFSVYRKKNIPGSKNVPMRSIEKILSAVSTKNASLFVCCPGFRSSRASRILKRMGCTYIKNIDRIASYIRKAAV